MNGLRSSIGWNLGSIPKSIHLFEPLTSVPINGTNIKKIKPIKNKITEKLIKIFFSKKEKKSKDEKKLIPEFYSQREYKQLVELKDFISK